MTKSYFLIFCVFFIVFQGYTQFSEDYIKTGKKHFQKQEYELAVAEFAKAKTISESKNLDDVYNGTFAESCGWLAKSLFRSGHDNINLFEVSLYKGIYYQSNEALDFYAMEYPVSITKINNIIKAHKYSKKDLAKIYYYKANIFAKDLKESSQNLAFQYLDKALKNKYGSKKELINNKFIANCNPEKYYQTLYNNGVVENVYSYAVKRYVENSINAWQKKGKFEKSLDYAERFTEQKRLEQIGLFTQFYIDSLGMAKTNLAQAQNEYDADNEVFKIHFQNGEPIFVPVPIEEAPDFDKNFASLEYIKPQFTIYNDKFEILHLEIHNKALDKTYAYDSKTVAPFNSDLLTYDFDKIELPSMFNNAPSASNKGIVNESNADVDFNIPANTEVKGNTYALIIGNEDYQSYQTGLSVEQNVEFAIKDAFVFKQYCNKTLGIPEENIIFSTNAGAVKMRQNIQQIKSIINTLNGEAEILFYYAGHGFPDETNKDPYLIPVDVPSNSLELALNLNEIISEFNENPSKRIVFFVDACFSGGGRQIGLLSSRGVKIVPKETLAKGNVVIFSASTADQSALSYKEKGHGLFTYFLLKKLQESNGKVNLGDLDDYLNRNVSIKSTLMYSREQNPKTMYSPSLNNDWQTWKL